MSTVPLLAITTISVANNPWLNFLLFPWRLFRDRIPTCWSFHWLVRVKWTTWRTSTQRCTIGDWFNSWSHFRNYSIFRISFFSLILFITFLGLTLQIVKKVMIAIINVHFSALRTLYCQLKYHILQAVHFGKI